ncbi:hypothetical protein TNCT_735101 [Trichonephila clavata]|uniref:Transposase n=1 Tax=Trichonephila clavata TaxID=2740835 RepID=A0A8X6GHQ3_TRICU|nr:hypothetical protein TNCT_735101 [Trichonephila clavata]
MRTARRPDTCALRPSIRNFKGLGHLQSFLNRICSCGRLNVKGISAFRNGAEMNMKFCFKMVLHNAMCVRRFLTQYHVTELFHPPYSPDLVPEDIFPFLKLKLALKGHRFSNTSDI